MRERCERAFYFHGMKLLALPVSAVVVAAACTHAPAPDEAAALREVRHADYTLILPTRPNALLVLFPGFGQDAADTRTESRITDEAVGRGVAVLLMEFNRHLFLTDAETTALVDTLGRVIGAELPQVPRVFLGGYSSGGNVAVLLAKRLARVPDPRIALKGVFVVDSPLDLATLYPIWKKHATGGMTESARGEGAMVVALLDSTLGPPTDSLGNYERYAPVTTSPASVAPLTGLAIRLYTEPDTAWWRINRDDRYEDMNACYLEKLEAELKAAGATKAEFITTQGRGIQHGRRHPHAWSIVEEKELVRWVLEDQASDPLP